MKKYVDYIVEEQNIINDDTFENVTNKLSKKISNFSDDLLNGFKSIENINNRSEQDVINISNKNKLVKKEKPKIKEIEPKVKLPTEKTKLYKKGDEYYTDNNILIKNPNLDQYELVQKEKEVV